MPNVRSTITDVSDSRAIFVRAESLLQKEMAQALISLVKTVESESRAIGATCRGIYRLKLESDHIIISFERFHAPLQVRKTLPVVESE